MDDPKYCGSPANSSVTLEIGIAYSGNSTASVVSLIGPHKPILAGTQSGSDLILSGTVQDPTENSLQFVLLSGSVASIATLSFPNPDLVLLQLADTSGKPFPCAKGKARRGKFVSLVCTDYSYGSLIVSGTIV